MCSGGIHHVQWGYTRTTLCSPPTTLFASHNLCSHCLHFRKTLIQLAAQHSSPCTHYHYLGACTNNFVFATNSFARHNHILLSHLPLYYCCFHPLYCNTIGILISSNSMYEVIIPNSISCECTNNSFARHNLAHLLPPSTVLLLLPSIAL